MLVFIKRSSPEICTFIKDRLGKREEVTLCFDEKECEDQA
jgi:hypothetical protein